MSPLEKQVAQRDGKTLVCPRCKDPLRVAFDEETEVDYCDHCKGVWVEFVNEKAILRIKPESFSIDELRRLRKLYQPWGRVEEPKYVPCPECSVLMNRKIWGDHSGVIVDICSQHGTWFDTGEIEKLREFVSLGGIEYEKLRLAEGGLNELDSRLTKEVVRLDTKIDATYRKARLWSLFLR